MYVRHVHWGLQRAKTGRRGVALLVIVGACVALVWAPAGSALLPLNDNFGSAQDVLLTPTTAGSNAAATAELGEPDHGNPNNLAHNSPCASGVSADGAVNPAFWSATDENPPLHSVWFKWTAPASGGCLTVDTFGSSFDTVMSVYTGNGYGSLTLVAGNDDYTMACPAGALGVPTNTTQSCVKFTATPGTTYYIAVDAGASLYGGPGGNYVLDWSLNVPKPDLAVSKTTTATSVNVGEPISYTILVTNQGVGPAPGSTLTDTLTGATVTAMSATPQGTCTPSTAGCSLGTIAAGQTVTVTVVATASMGGTVNNSATATTTATDVDPTNNTGTADPVTVNPPGPDLVVSKTTTVSTANTGNPIAYTVTVSNQGSASAPNVTLIETPIGATIASMSPSQGTCGAPTCSLGTIAPGGSATVTVVLVATTAGTVSNSATATTTGAESNTTNNSGTASDVTVTAPPPGCTAAGKVEASGHWHLPSAAKNKGGEVQAEFEGACEYDKKTHTFVLRNAHLELHGSGAPSIDAKTDGKRHDVVTLTISGHDAVAAGTYNGTSFTVTMHDGGKGHKNDAMQVDYVTFTTAALISDHAEVHIDDD